MTDTDVAVVVGAGQAGSELAICLRQNGFDGRIVLLGAERHMPYQRPPLSKALLKGDAAAHDLRVRSPDAAAEAGAEVIVLEIADRILGRTNPAVVSEFFTRLHRAHGVSLRTGATLCSARRMRNGRIHIQLGDGTNISADLILAGIGLIPNDDLARAAGLDVSDGILVDSQARTSQPDVVAAGDCTRQFHGLLRREVRLESQQNAVEQARIAARTLCGSTTESFNVPTFWSDQYDHRLQMVGLPLPDDEQVLRGDPDSGSFSVVFLRGGRLSAVHAVGRPRDITAGRKLIAAQAHLRPPHDIAVDGPLADLAIT
ncbi:NAD(P)/FAD-dependent oxidoreductase [Mycolicibacterium goodii]|uniref:Pyridine nucleotide-disulfide oxidoreductase n=1 Tax=Mycolicibacterium goodii TaxID=134601 RepID=A0A0K0X8R6_MYCGD|nr:hypothetical protein AFA91_19865 [Mycolicibacterium goodii]